MPLSKSCVLAIAVCASANGTMAATQVNIGDPNKATRAANVEIGNRLAVQEVAPAAFYHSAHFGIGAGCVRIAAPPSGKALIVRQVRITTVSVDPGPNTYLVLYVNSTCSDAGAVADLFPQSIGLTPVVFDPGVTVPMG